MALTFTFDGLWLDIIVRNIQGIVKKNKNQIR